MARQPSVPQAVRQFWETLDPVPNGVVVAVSGGADSVALLRALQDIGVGRLVVAHFNHGLRGKESDDDASFVADLARKLDLPFRAGGGVSSATSEAKLRAERYAWLAQSANDLNVAWVATGHSADDQAETVLFRLLRGTGIDGLAGVRVRRLLAPGVRAVRPLLRVSREAIVEYLRGIEQPWREDSSNQDRRYTRNRIRHELLPLLKREYNPRVSEALARLGEQAALCRRISVGRIAGMIRKIELPRAGRAVVFGRADLERMSVVSLKRFWHAVWQREQWPMGSMGSREYERIAEWCRSSSAALELPGGIRMKRMEQTIVAGPNTKE